jgi:antirestriction protein ArdC
VKDKFFFMRQFTVFNVEQTNGLDKFRVGFGEPQDNATERYENADAVIDATGADIRYGGNQAFYSPSDDYVQLPMRSQFVSAESYYETTFHELCHWSECRVGFDRAEAENSYAYAELVAEIGCIDDDGRIEFADHNKSGEPCRISSELA